MFQERNEYRKILTSSGQLYLSGELLDFVSYDVSVKGILIEIVPGTLLSDVSDFEALIKENNAAEIYVKDLMLAGKVDIAWVKEEKGKVLLGLEFQDVMYNAEKLWRKRQYFRSRRRFLGTLVIDDRKLNFQGLNVSTVGLSLQLDLMDEVLQPKRTVKLMLNDLDIKGMGKIVWVKTFAEEVTVLGLKYLIIE